MTPMQFVVAQATSAPVRQIENNPIGERIIDALTDSPGLTRKALCEAVERSSSRVDLSLRDLIQRGMVVITIERPPGVRSFHRYCLRRATMR